MLIDVCEGGFLVPVDGGVVFVPPSLRHVPHSTDRPTAGTLPADPGTIWAYILDGAQVRAAAYFATLSGEDRERFVLVRRGWAGAPYETTSFETLIESTQFPGVLAPGSAPPGAVRVVSKGGLAAPATAEGQWWLLPLAVTAAQESLRSIAVAGPHGSSLRLDHYLAEVDRIRDRIGVGRFSPDSPELWPSAVLYAAGAFASWFDLAGRLGAAGLVDQVLPMRFAQLVALTGGSAAPTGVDALSAWLSDTPGGGALVRLGSASPFLVVNDPAGAAPNIRWLRPGLAGSAAEVRADPLDLTRLRQLFGNARLNAVAIGPDRLPAMIDAGHRQVQLTAPALDAPASSGPAFTTPIAAAGLPSGAPALEPANAEGPPAFGLRRLATLVLGALAASGNWPQVIGGVSAEEVSAGARAPVPDDGMPGRVVLYHQTLLDGNRYVPLMDLVERDTGLTHLIIAAVHFDDSHRRLPYLSPPTDTVVLNDDPPESARLAPVWRDLPKVRDAGVRVLLMIGGAGGGFRQLRDDFELHYGSLSRLLRARQFDGVDLNVEERVGTEFVAQLIQRLRTDFGPDLIITLSPPVNDVVTYNPTGPHSDVSYPELMQRHQDDISFVNVQFYNNRATLHNPLSYPAAVTFLGHKTGVFEPDKVVAGVLTNPLGGSLGYLPPPTLNDTITRLRALYPTMGGVAGWEYFWSMPGGKASPWEWAQAVSPAMRADPRLNVRIQVNSAGLFFTSATVYLADQPVARTRLLHPFGRRELDLDLGPDHAQALQASLSPGANGAVRPKLRVEGRSLTGPRDSVDVHIEEPGMSVGVEFQGGIFQGFEIVRLHRPATGEPLITTRQFYVTVAAILLLAPPLGIGLGMGIERWVDGPIQRDDEGYEYSLGDFGIAGFSRPRPPVLAAMSTPGKLTIVLNVDASGQPRLRKNNQWVNADADTLAAFIRRHSSLQARQKQSLQISTMGKATGLKELLSATYAKLIELDRPELAAGQDVAIGSKVGAGLLSGASAIQPDAVFRSAGKAGLGLDPHGVSLPAGLMRMLRARTWSAAEAVFARHRATLVNRAAVKLLAGLDGRLASDRRLGAIRTALELELAATSSGRSAERVAPAAKELWDVEPAPAGPVDARFAFDYLADRPSRTERLRWDALLLSAVAAEKMSAEQARRLMAARRDVDAELMVQVFDAVNLVRTLGAAGLASAMPMVSWENCKLPPDVKWAWMLWIERLAPTLATPARSAMEALADHIADCV